MGEKGWIKISRGILENDLWEDKPFSEGQAWIDLLLLAEYKPRTVYLKGKEVELQPGQLVISERALMKRWGWGNTRVRSFFNKAQAKRMLTKNHSADQSNSQSIITIVKWGTYQISQSTEQSTNQSATKAQPTQNQSTYQEERNKENVNTDYMGGNNNINNNYIYTPLPPADKIEPLPELTQEQIRQIVETWNAIPHTVNLSGIFPTSKRYDRLRIVISVVTYEGVLRAIQRVKDSEWLQRKGHATFDTFIADKDNIQKTIEGNFDKDFETERKPKTTAKTTRFNNFPQRDYDYAELEKKLRTN